MARTKSQLKKLHRELWQWLADNPKKAKFDWPEWVVNDGTIRHPFDNAECTCFACEASVNHDEVYCPNCPCRWGDDTCLDAMTPYKKWKRAHTVKLRTKYALQVRDAWK